MLSILETGVVWGTITAQGTARAAAAAAQPALNVQRGVSEIVELRVPIRNMGFEILITVTYIFDERANYWAKCGLKASPVVARRVSNDAPLGSLVIEGEDCVYPPSILEGSCDLQVLALEVHVDACCRVDPRRFQHRRVRHLGRLCEPHCRCTHMRQLHRHCTLNAVSRKPHALLN
jgi:hypothetical protein